MGYRISWLGARGLPKTDLLHHFGLVDSGIYDEANEAPFSAAELPTGWTILWANDPAFATIARCTELSLRAPVVSCWVNETAMVSSVNYFEAGDYLWFVGHDFQKGPDDLVFEGEVPPSFEEIRGRLDAQRLSYGDTQPAVDFIFDVPIELAQSVAGYRHDQVAFDWGTPQFTEATVAPERPGGMLQKLFGARR
jgi:hypothetical protein